MSPLPTLGIALAVATTVMLNQLTLLLGHPSHSRSFDQRRRPETFLTAMATLTVLDTPCWLRGQGTGKAAIAAATEAPLEDAVGLTAWRSRQSKKPASSSAR